MGWVEKMAAKLADLNAKHKTGGAAFPHCFDDGESTLVHPGMTLRDYFAGQALAGLVAFPGRAGEANDPHHFARWSYALADAMLEAREK